MLDENNELSNKELFKKIVKKTSEVLISSCISIYDFLNPPPPPRINNYNLLDWLNNNIDIAAMNNRLIPILDEVLEGVKPIDNGFFNGLFYIEYSYLDVKDNRIKEEKNRIGLILSQLLTASVVAYYSKFIELNCNLFVLVDAESAKEVNRLRIYYYCYFESEKVLNLIRKQLFV